MLNPLDPYANALECLKVRALNLFNCYCVHVVCLMCVYVCTCIHVCVWLSVCMCVRTCVHVVCVNVALVRAEAAMMQGRFACATH